MLDMAWIRKFPDQVKAAVRNKNEKLDIDAILGLDEERRRLLTEVESLRAQKNRASQEIGRLIREGKDPQPIRNQMKQVAEREKALERELGEVEGKVTELLRWVPNVPAEDVTAAPDASGNVEVRRWGEHRKFDVPPKAHWDVSRDLGLVDWERGPKLAGSGFILFIGLGARLERALINFMLDLHTREHGYTEVFPPFLVTEECMFGTGQLPKLAQDMYQLPNERMYLIPTAEVPVTNIYREEILTHEDLPKYFVSYTACFRREAGAAGKDTRGMIRVHQFDKVELVKFVHPSASYEELEKLVANAEKVLQLLGLEYRVMKLCTGDMSFASSKTYDIEVYAPGLDKWLEVSSCSNFEDFQARRAGIRFRDKDDGKLKFVHTLNGSGVALPRTVIALLENYQQADGSVEIPEALRPYLGGLSRIEPPRKGRGPGEHSK